MELKLKMYVAPVQCRKLYYFYNECNDIFCITNLINICHVAVSTADVAATKD